MSAIHVVFLGSSSVVGTNLSSPTTERYSALHQTWLRSNRNTHCRCSIVALAGIGLYEQQATGFSTPANRSGRPVNTTNNVTTALALRPDFLVLHQPNPGMDDFEDLWGATTVADYEDAVDNELIGLADNIRVLCANQGVGFAIIGSHPPTAAAKSTNSWTDNQITGRHYWNDTLATWCSGLGIPFADTWDDTAVGTNYSDAAHEVAPVYNAGDLAASKLLSDGVHHNATFLASTVEPTHVRSLGLATYRDRWTQLDVVA